MLRVSREKGNLMRVLTQAELQAFHDLVEVPEVAFGIFEVTQTQLQKSIIDAQDGIRRSFQRTGYHNYELQMQGQNAKKVHPITVVTRNGPVASTISLYKPESKEGDPRLWISGFPRLSPETEPGHVFVLMQNGNDCVGFNLTFLAKAGTGTDPLGPPESNFARVLKGTISQVFGRAPRDGGSPRAIELLEKLRALMKLGPIPSFKQGPTAVGHAVETALGIKQNSSKNPDFYGIEIKASRAASRTRMTLFAQVADWTISSAKSSGQILDRYGYIDKTGVRALQCSISAARENNQGLQFVFDFEQAVLEEVFVSSGAVESVAKWPLQLLERRLLEKHTETFWIEADEVTYRGNPAFNLRKAKYTTAPDLPAFSLLLANGDIEMDHLIKDRPGRGISEKGPLFKIWPKDLPVLFRIVGEYSLE